MAEAKAKISSYLHGYPNRVGNKNQVVLNMIGPASGYIADGVLFDKPKHVTYVHKITCSGAKGAGGKRYSVIPIFATNPAPDLATRIRLIFIDMDTGVEPANDTDLSAATFTMELMGTP